MLSYQEKKFHCEDKKVLRSSYLHKGISYTGKIYTFTFTCDNILGPTLACEFQGFEVFGKIILNVGTHGHAS